MNNEYVMYLRKSRQDIELENRGEEETLKRHERMLLDLARQKELHVTQIYREVVSGETIASRPQMQRLLSEVEQGMWAGVLVVEVERLARGDSIDQGIVSQAFKYSNTLIVTPQRVYNPNNEFDEEYFEFGLFMSRREYNTIKRRLQAGRYASFQEGKFTGNLTPYGYDRIKLEGQKGFTLKRNEREAPVIEKIFELYTVGELKEDGTRNRIGMSLICRYLNAKGFSPKHADNWMLATVRDILKNPVYAGLVHHGRKKTIKMPVDGKLVEHRIRSDEYETCEGLHPALVSKETFDLAQYYMSQNNRLPSGRHNSTTNPLAGLMICGCCGRKMQRRPYKGKRVPSLICYDVNCSCVSSPFEKVEERVISGLEDWLNKYKIELSLEAPRPLSTENDKTLLTTMLKDVDDTKKQLDKAYEFLEKGLYSEEIFLHRSKTLSKRIEELNDNIEKQNHRIEQIEKIHQARYSIIPAIEHVLDAYYDADSPQDRNALLRSVLDRVVYTKTERNTKNTKIYHDFKLDIFPKLPNG